MIFITLYYIGAIAQDSEVSKVEYRIIRVKFERKQCTYNGLWLFTRKRGFRALRTEFNKENLGP